MNYNEYIDQISFRVLQPDKQARGFARLTKRWPWLAAQLEIFNTRIPEGADTTQDRLKPLCHIPRMSTYALGAMINRAVSEMPADQCFVNVGVWNGFSFLSGMAGNEDKTCIGVDNFSEFGGPREAFLARFEQRKGAKHSFYDMDYRDYFNDQHKGAIGFYFYDGEHSYENQLESLQVAEPYLADNAIILVDDTNLEAPQHAIRTFLQTSKNRYEIILEKLTYANLHPTLWNGVTVLRMVGQKNQTGGD